MLIRMLYAIVTDWTMDEEVLEGLAELFAMAEEEAVRTPLTDCIICYSPLQGQDTGMLGSCRHRFCLGCIRQWLLRSSTCPIDRTPGGPDRPDPRHSRPAPYWYPA